MYLKHINLINFKNIDEAELSFCEGINCFIGSNGAGKTNVLDAIYYMSFCKSFFNHTDSINIMHKKDFFVLQGNYSLSENQENIYCGIKRGQKKIFKRNKKEYDKLSNHIGLIPLVMVSPQDENLIVDGGEQRRKYLDSVISQYDKSYLEHLIRYNKIIVQRNSYLKTVNRLTPQVNDVLDIWDMQLSDLGEKISFMRSEFLNRLKEVFYDIYDFITEGKEHVDFIYKSHFLEDNFLDKIKQSREKDLILGYTTKGVHRDDVEFLIDSYSIKKIGSQGQKKSFLLALKLSQFKFLTEHKHMKPILLLDDIFDKLDKKRGSKLIELVGGDMFKQIFITDTDANRIKPVLDAMSKPSKIFFVDNGEFNLLS